ncbi:hypothetical protein MC885_004496, partial [Smutsia gigantea]
SPYLTLQVLRERLGEFLSEDAVAEKCLFLKCIGSNLAVVKAKQESELKLKSFAPPYALQPELYLLPIMDHFGNIYSVSTVSLNGQQTNNDVAAADGIIHRPVSVVLPKEQPGTDPSFLENTLEELLNKNQEEAGRKPPPKENMTGKIDIGNSELTGSSENSNNSYFSSKKSHFLWKNEDDRVNIRREENQIGKKECITLPDLIDFPSRPCQPTLSPGLTGISLLRIEREKIIEQMKQVKEERRYLERIREELIKKVEKLFEQSKLKQYHVKNKRVVVLSKEIFLYLTQNYLIIQITEVQHVIDQLKRKLDTDKMQLIIEVKRKQAGADLCTLKAELEQKKINTSLSCHL